METTSGDVVARWPQAKAAVATAIKDTRRLTVTGLMKDVPMASYHLDRCARAATSRKTDGKPVAREIATTRTDRLRSPTTLRVVQSALRARSSSARSRTARACRRQDQDLLRPICLPASSRVRSSK